MEIVVNPTEENPSTLRALALMLNSIASDRDGGYTASQIAAAPKAAVITQETLPPLVGNEQPAAPGASTDSTPPPPPPNANAAADSNTSLVLDKNGLPWDVRIHSSSKNLNADGTWRYLRGGDVDLRASVEAELRAKLASGETPPPPPIVVTGQGTVTAETSDLTPPPPPPPVVEPPADAPPAGITAAVVFKRINELKNAKKIDQDGINAALASVDVESLQAFMKLAKDDAGLPELVLDALNAIAGDE